ncbi:MAG TPA: alpha-glucan family phosphorylase [Bacteroidales bacterium]|nr:alpha-glucan family phosphorylase [Bacteroidales bacterium]
MSKDLLTPDYLFEVSWEVCNKVGGIHTVIATKALTMINELQNNLILIGPDLIKDESDANPEFIEDPQLFSAWKKQAESEGLYVKIGRWNINRYPIAIVLNFSNYFAEKDKIFFELWEKYKLDSLPGQWDYVEPALFGYAAGKVIESFIKFNLNTYDRIIAQFHEWMTGTGILYLKDRLPQVGTVFTTHATALGRALAGNNRPLYKNLQSYNAEEVAREFNIISKQSAEKLSAQNADAFTTVSEITAQECTQFLQKEVTLVTPNGFEDSFVPVGAEFDILRKKGREKLLNTAEIMLERKFDENVFMIATSGRYEFKNKGIDLFIDSLGVLNKSEKLNRDIIAYLFIPANHYGARKDLLSGKLTDDGAIGSKYLTHNLHDAEWDPILKRIREAGLTNGPNDKVKVIFVPSYLNGYDGVFNIPYYSLLIGFDLTVFPSYYEPWGYTPLESIAFSVPTITTTLAGFGSWINEMLPDAKESVDVIPRTDDNDHEVVTNIVSAVLKKCGLDENLMSSARANALDTSKQVLWNSLIQYYKKAYNHALQEVAKRIDRFVKIEERPSEIQPEFVPPAEIKPSWKKIIVKSKLPDELVKLGKLTENLWWSWDDEAQELFESIDPEIWQKCDQNPAILFEQVKYGQLVEMSKNPEFTEKLDRVYNRFQEYMSDELDKTGPRIAYFSMEYGFHNSLKIYSGGLGILAGDYLKEASDRRVNITGIGLLYRYGYFAQMITTRGEQQANYDYQHFSKLPVRPLKDDNGNFITISIVLPGRHMLARIWKLMVGRVTLYLLDTDFKGNTDEDRSVTHNLYGGNNENRLKQELLLGIGGIRALDAIGVNFDLYHSNEGHSAFIALERMRKYIQQNNLSFAEAKEIVRSSTLFTTHTPVPAGHDEFDENLLRQYIGHYPDRLKISWNELMSLGRSNINAWGEKFNMSYLAANLSQQMNGVSMIHGTVTQQMFSKLWPGYLPEELHISYVTNGIHYATWTAKSLKKLYRESFGEGFENNLSDTDYWEKIYAVPDARLWEIKQKLRSKLINTIKDRFKENWVKRHEDPRRIVAINRQLSDKALTICFARRFATYKRAYLLFRNTERLAQILNIPGKPVQLIFAGKAHPNDKAGQDLIRMIIDISKRPEFLGKIVFLQNYDINLAKTLVQGADVWLNTPTRPLEASGTSGEKAVVNGTLHFSVLDGWWVEGYQPDAGWALTNETTYEDSGLQDDLDAEIIYSLLEQEVIPAFFDRNKSDVPENWVRMMKNTIASIAPHFVTSRMLHDYNQRFYSKLFERSQLMEKDDFARVKRFSSWKKRIKRAWKNINVVECSMFENGAELYEMDRTYSGKVILDLNEISASDIGVELVITENGERLIQKHEFKLDRSDADKAQYSLKVTINQAGTFSYGIRIFPRNENLAHRQDINLIRWI